MGIRVFSGGGGGGGGTWGTITGTLADQTDLQTALDARATTALGNLASVAINAALNTAAGTNLTLAATAPAAAAGASQAGKTAALSASAAVASTDTAGAAAGGSVTITAGAAARLTSGNANGGDITLTPGAGIGTGTAGKVVIDSTTPTITTGSAVDLLIQHNGTTVQSIKSTGTTLVAGQNLFGAGALGSGFKRLTYFTAGLSLNGDTHSHYVFGNIAAASKNSYTLTASPGAGVEHDFIVLDVDGVRVTANTGDTIRVLDKVTAPAGYLESVTIGSTLKLLSIDNSTWIATSIHGAWTDGTFTYDDTGLTSP